MLEAEDISGSCKACTCIDPGNWRDTFMVPQGWTATTCSAWCTTMAGSVGVLIQITETGWSYPGFVSYP